MSEKERTQHIKQSILNRKAISNQIPQGIRVSIEKIETRKRIKPIRPRLGTQF